MSGQKENDGGSSDRSRLTSGDARAPIRTCWGEVSESGTNLNGKAPQIGIDDFVSGECL